MQGVWLLPSLDRASLLKEFIQSYKETESSTDVWVLVDKTDPQKDQYLAIDYPSGITLMLTDAKTMGDKVREVWDRIIEFDWVGILNDDHRPRTKSWDQRVISQIVGHNIVATNDGWVAPNRIAGAICFSGGFLRALGYMFLPNQHHLFSDDVWAHVSNRAQAGRLLMDVLVEHDHAYKNEKLRDRTFYTINGPKGLLPTGQGEGGFWDTDRKVFEEWMNSGQAEKDAQKILDIQPKTGIMIATPSHDGNCFLGFALGMTDTATFFQQNNIYFEMARVVGSSLIPHARNSLVDMFLKSKCQRLLMMDADQGFDRNTVYSLLSSPKKIIAGIVPHKRFPINLNFEPLPEHHKYFQSLVNKGYEEFKIYAKEVGDQKGIIEVNRSGTGCMMIDRSVFEIMINEKDLLAQYEAFDNDPSKLQHEYFKMGAVGVTDSIRYRGEDWQFCEMAKKCNIPIHINANSICTHHGQYTFQVG